VLDKNITTGAFSQRSETGDWNRWVEVPHFEKSHSPPFQIAPTITAAIPIQTPQIFHTSLWGEDKGNIGLLLKVTGVDMPKADQRGDRVSCFALIMRL
jgi:hypothetical protein